MTRPLRIALAVLRVALLVILFTLLITSVANAPGVS